MGGVQILHNIIICEETASECLPYARTVPKIVQIPAFLFSRDWLLKCVCFKVLIHAQAEIGNPVTWIPVQDFKEVRLETQIEARTWLILGSFRPNTCAYLDYYKLDTLHWK